MNIKQMKNKPVGVTMDWSGKPCLLFSDNKILYSRKAEKILYPEYYPNNCEYPIDPKTGKMLSLVKGML